jgi:hypothetical protein
MTVGLLAGSTVQKDLGVKGKSVRKCNGVSRPENSMENSSSHNDKGKVSQQPVPGTSFDVDDVAG